MSDTVESLPAEYRTPSLESLPKELQVLAVRNIRTKFSLGEEHKHTDEHQRMTLSHLSRRARETINDRYEFYVGQKVIHKRTGMIDRVESMPGQVKYDRKHFLDAEIGFCLESHGWEHQESWRPLYG